MHPQWHACVQLGARTHIYTIMTPLARKGGGEPLADHAPPLAHLCVQLATLKLDHAGLGDQGCAHIAQALQVNTSLRTLDLSSNSAASDTGMVLSATLKVSWQRQNSSPQARMCPLCGGANCECVCVCAAGWLAHCLQRQPAGNCNG